VLVLPPPWLGESFVDRAHRFRLLVTLISHSGKQLLLLEKFPFFPTHCWQNSICQHQIVKTMPKTRRTVLIKLGAKCNASF
jgi:hypothetical protein